MVLSFDGTILVWDFKCVIVLFLYGFGFANLARLESNSILGHVDLNGARYFHVRNRTVYCGRGQEKGETMKLLCMHRDWVRSNALELHQ